ncbi:guanine nucleotide exchange factor [Thelephora terrestris]|uniref:Guanine nucleotide exchange factor n=1 Tax=Thelephora terrestris TaxID=56493 RepID=A0A9P6L482_9AGAM|nr:guanine nucleotide exchange factor [Thelephora terrestris]
MADVLKQYSSLSSSSESSEVNAVLGKIINAGPEVFDNGTRISLIELLLKDINARAQNIKSNDLKISIKDVAHAILALKVLGRNPVGSDLITRPSTLSILISAAEAFKDTPNATSEVLRCIANGLLLISDSRSTFVNKEVGGGPAVLGILERETSPDLIFVTSRLLFLSTASSATAGDFIKDLVEGKVSKNGQNVVNILAQKLDALLSLVVLGTPMAREAMSEMLKFGFNVLCFYPRIVGVQESRDDWDSTDAHGAWPRQLEGILPPLLRTFNSLPPTYPSPITPPMTQLIHSLIMIPVSAPLHQKWFPQPIPPSSQVTYASKSSSATISPASKGIPTPSMAVALDSSLKEVKTGKIDRALSLLSACSRPLRSPPPNSSIQDTLLHAYNIMDVTLARYLPDALDPDDASVREKCKRDDTTLDELVTPLVLLIARICIGDEASRARLRAWLIPLDLDRTNPLEARPDALGRCLRLLGSVYHANLKKAVGEMMYAMCDLDASILASQVGYGNVAGFLFSKGVMSPPPQPSTSSNAVYGPSTSSTGAPINPITGIAQQPVTVTDMTDEEKEREAEKLFVLFDRLEKSGAIQPDQNPIRKAAEQGKLG